MKRLHCTLCVLFALFAFAQVAQAQDACVNWNTLSAAEKERAETAHVVYRGIVNTMDDRPEAERDYEQAYEQWKIAYDLAPAADGGRPFHYSDGRKIFTQRFKNATDAAAKKEAADMVLKLYDEQVACYPDNKAMMLGRKAYDMFYTFNSSYEPNLQALEEAIELGGNNTEYIVYDPVARIVVYQYKKNAMDKDRARNLYERLNDIADYNIENNETYKQYYTDARKVLNGVYAEIEDDLFDCAYFRAKLEPSYRDNPDDIEVLKYVYNKLKGQGCDPNLPIMQELSAKYTSIASEMNAEMEAERRRNNPAYDAAMLKKEGNVSGAIARYQDAVQAEADPSKKADYLLTMATMQYRELKDYGTARNNAREAASLKSGWGAPYLLIGDMYAASANRCGDNAYERGLVILAALDKYAYAKSIDPSIAGDANKRIGRYSGSKPPKDEVFMKGTQGKSDNTGCWIGETVKVRY